MSNGLAKLIGSEETALQMNQIAYLIEERLGLHDRSHFVGDE